MDIAHPRYDQRQSPFWWTRNPASTVYFVRELTGFFIVLYCFLFISTIDVDSTLFAVVSWICLVAAVFHTITWLWVTVKIAPVPLPKPVQIFGFAFLIAVWLGLSYFLLKFLYVAL